jgi:hypothetical protein
MGPALSPAPPAQSPPPPEEKPAEKLGRLVEEL